MLGQCMCVCAKTRVFVYDIVTHVLRILQYVTIRFIQTHNIIDKSNHLFFMIRIFFIF